MFLLSRHHRRHNVLGAYGEVASSGHNKLSLGGGGGSSGGVVRGVPEKGRRVHTRITVEVVGIGSGTGWVALDGIFGIAGSGEG